MVLRARVVIILQVTKRKVRSVFHKKWYEKRGFGLVEVAKFFISLTYFMDDNTVLNARNREKTTSYFGMWADA